MGRSALVLMDLQNEIVDAEGKAGAEGLAEPVARHRILERTRQLLDAVRGSETPILHVVVAYRPGHPELPTRGDLAEWFREEEMLIEGSWGAQIHPLVAPEPGEPVVVKRGVSSFANSDLDLLLRHLEVDHVVLAGVATPFVVEGTARDAFDRGYRFTVLRDCCTGSSDEAHERSLTFLAHLGEVTTSADWLAGRGA